MKEKIRCIGKKSINSGKKRGGRPRKLKFLQDMRQTMGKEEQTESTNIQPTPHHRERSEDHVCLIDVLKNTRYITTDQFYAGRFFLTWWRKNCQSLDVPQWATPKRCETSLRYITSSSASSNLIDQTEEALAQWLSQDKNALGMLRLLNEHVSHPTTWLGDQGLKKLSEYLTHICLIFNHLSL